MENKKLCIGCKYHWSSCRQHYCEYPDWLSPVDGNASYCSQNRADKLRCHNGSKWEAEPVVVSKDQRSWWQKLFY